MGCDWRELFHLAPHGYLTAMPAQGGASFAAGVPEPLLRLDAVRWYDRYDYAVAPPGDRFIVNRQLPDAAATQRRVVLNWAALLGTTDFRCRAGAVAGR
jgi:hypothetical protein